MLIAGNRPEQPLELPLSTDNYQPEASCDRIARMLSYNAIGTYVFVRFGWIFSPVRKMKESSNVTKKNWLNQ